MEREKFKASLESIFSPFGEKTCMLSECVKCLIVGDTVKLAAMKAQMLACQAEVDHYLEAYDAAPTPVAKDAVIASVKKGKL